MPDMNVTAETSGQSPWARTTSSAPSPLSVVISGASGKRPSSDAAASSSPPAFVATMPRSNGSSSSGIAPRPCTSAWRSLRPVTRSPSRLSASACSRRRVSTETSATWARWPANRLPITPAPITQTRSITRRCATSAGDGDRRRGITEAAKSSWFLIAIQCGAPPALTVIAISEIPGQIFWVSSIRSTISSGVPTQT